MQIIDGHEISGTPGDPEGPPWYWGIGDTLASKAYSAIKGDAHLTIKLRKWSDGQYVTHIYNAQSDGHIDGRYFDNSDDAVADFIAR